MLTRGRNERGQVVVLFALLFPVLMAIGAIVIGIGNWYTHARHLQTKADAAAFAGGGVWAFPCASDIDARIEAQARQFVGPHTKADTTVFNATTLNKQVGGVGADQIHVVLNGSFFDDGNTSVADKTSPANASYCDAKILDVKATEHDSFPLFSLIPLFPDLKKKARVQIEEIEGLSGLLPIAVRVPEPLSAAAVFYNEENGDILSVAPLCKDSNGTIANLPAGLGGWSSFDPSDPNPACALTGWSTVNTGATTGVAIATSFRAACGVGPSPCFQTSGFATVNALCNQGVVECFYASGSGTSQNMESGLQFIRGFSSGNVTNGPPQVRSVWFDTVSPSPCAEGFSAGITCTATLHADVDRGTAPGRTPDNVDVKYGVVEGTTAVTGDDCLDGQNRPNCDMPNGQASVTFDPQFNNQGDPQAVRHAVFLRVRLKNTTVGNTDCGNNFSATCQWFFTSDSVGVTTLPTQAQVFASPAQRYFTGDINESGPVKWLRLSSSSSCSGLPDMAYGQAASQVGGTHCFYVDLGFQGGLARDQDEPPIALNLGTTSQRSLLDCDPGLANLPDEIIAGCSPYYAVNTFTKTDPTTGKYCPNVNGVNQFFSVPKPSPFDDWPPYRCVITQSTASGNQLMQGFNQRLFGVNNNPTCPTDDATRYVKGRNYWHRDNNLYDDANYAWDSDTPAPQTSDDLGNRLRDDDPRLITLFFTGYGSFTGNGNEVYPIVAFGNFYITGYGRISGGSLNTEDPCADGNDSNLYNGNGNERPPDLNLSRNTTYLWGHFVKNVTPAPFTTGGTGVLCQPLTSYQPCVAVLVE